MNIICFSDISWDFLWQRHYHLLSRFPVSWKILFLEPMSYKGLKDNPFCIFPRKKGNIILISRPLVPLFEKNKVLRKINDILVFLYVKFVSCIFNMKKPVLLYYEPRFSSLIGHLNEKLVLYEFIDNKLGFSEVQKWMSYYIDILMKKSHIITASSRTLYEYALESGAKNVYLLNNAVDNNHFKRKYLEIPEDINHLARPIIGYTGTISDWLDYELITKVAAGLPDSTILLIGPIDPKQMKTLSILGKYDNIIFIGKKSYNDLPAYINQFNVAIIPFKINLLTNFVNPIKLYEYMASGKPVVSTALPDIKEYKDMIYLANNPEEFLEYIKLALKNKDNIHKYTEVLKENSWDNRAEQMINLIENNYRED